MSLPTRFLSKPINFNCPLCSLSSCRRPGKRVMILNGEYRDTEAVLEGIDEKKFSATLTLDSVSTEPKRCCYRVSPPGLLFPWFGFVYTTTAILLKNAVLLKRVSLWLGSHVIKLLVFTFLGSIERQASGRCRLWGLLENAVTPPPPLAISQPISLCRALLCQSSFPWAPSCCKYANLSFGGWSSVNFQFSKDL